MEKQDYKKAFKDLYQPKNQPGFINVPTLRFCMLSGEGNPNSEPFALATSALYSFSYAVKMSYKSKNIPEGFYDYTVFPLEGVWDLIDTTRAATDKDNLKYTIMIRQPDFLTPELFERFLSETKKKKPNPFLDALKFEVISEGLCCQMLHLGSYDSEPASFSAMEVFCAKQGYKRVSHVHREIYLSNPLTTEPEKLKTILRFQIEKS